MIKAILFDFDGVLTLDATGSLSIRNYVCKETGLDIDLFKKEYSKYNDDLLYGKIKHEEIWDKLCNELNEEISIEVLYDSFINTPINNEMYNLIKEIKSKNYKTGMVTDNKKDRIDRIAEYYKFDSLFDTIIVSADLGSGKENEEIFMKTMQRLNVTAQECIFIDNQEKNLVIPKELGMNVIFYDHKENNIMKLVKELRDLEIDI